MFGEVAQLDRASAFELGAFMWKIKKIISKGEYLYALVPEHPKATKNGYVLMHRIIVENFLGRILNKNEVVHHKDGNKTNNVIENLEVVDYREHSKLHRLKQGKKYVKLKCPWCNKIFELPQNQSFLVKPSKYKCNCCSSTCRGKLYREIQLHGITHKLESAISENLLLEYKKYIIEDNSEETHL